MDSTSAKYHDWFRYIDQTSRRSRKRFLAASSESQTILPRPHLCVDVYPRMNWPWAMRTALVIELCGRRANPSEQVSRTDSAIRFQRGGVMICELFESETAVVLKRDT